MQCHSDLEAEIKDMDTGKKVQIDVSSRKSTFFRISKILLSGENLYGMKVHVGYADISLYFKVDVVLMKWDG